MPERQIRIWPSAADRFLACPSSALPPERPELAQDPSSPEARSGSSGHEVAACVPHGREPDLEEIASRYGADPDDLGYIHWAASKAWEELGVYFPECRDEVKLTHSLGNVELAGDELAEVVLSGRLDLLAAPLLGDALELLSVGDWKTGRGRTTHRAQIKAGALLAVYEHGMPATGAVLGVEIWLRHGDREIVQLDEQAIDGFQDELLTAAGDVGRKWGAGPHCVFCQHEPTCELRAAWVRSSIRDLCAMVLGDEPVPREILGTTIREQLTLLRRVVANVDKLIAAELERGPIDLGDGTAWVYGERITKPISFSAGAHVIDQVVASPEELDRVVKVSKDKLLKLAASRVPKGKGAAAKRELLSQLGQAGAILEIPGPIKQVVGIEKVSGAEPLELGEADHG